MRCSTCVGTLTDKRELHKEIKDEFGEVIERYYRTEFIVDGQAYPAVGSEYILRDISGKVSIEKYIRSENNPKNGKLLTFIQIITCKEVSPETPDDNFVMMGGVVRKTRGILPSRTNGMENLPFMIRYTSYDKNHNIAHCIAREVNARRMSNMEIGDIVEFEGSLKLTKGTIEVEVSKVVLHRKPGPRKGKR